MADTDEGFLDDELTPPSAERVAKRALVMSAVVYRAFLEPYANEPDIEIHCQEVLIWLKRFNLLEELEANEQEILNAPPGQLDARQAIDGTWRSEGLVILAWALNRFDLPGYDKLVDPKELTDSLKFLSDEAENLLVSPRL